MADTYITLPIDTDPEDVLNDAYDMMQTLIPGWQPSPGNLDTWILMAVATAASESRDVASEVSKSIFRWYGANLIGLQPVDATQAYGRTTWTLIDALGHTIPAGTQVAISDISGNVFPFETTTDIIVPPGSSTTIAGDVQIVAIAAGADANNLGGVGTPITLLDPLDFVLSIVTTAATSGGQDAESDDDYLNRLAANLELLAPRPILPEDFSVFARNVPGAWRALTIDGYNPAGGGTYNNPRTVTVVAVDQAGQPVSSTVKTAIDDDLEARREVNFLVYEADATITQIDINYTVTALVGFDKVLLKSNIDAALQAYLNPADWGTTENDSRAWRQITKIRYLEVSQVINNVLGVDYISALTTGIHGSAVGTVDIDLPGIAPLPQASALTGTVN